MSLTTCISKAGAYLRDEDRAQILRRASELRDEGQSAHEAGVSAITEQAAAVKQMLDAAEAELAVARSAERDDLFPEDFAGDDDTVETARVTSSRGDTAKGGNVNSAGQRISGTKQGLKNFWRWFGASDAVDEEGRPLVMYHSTRGNISQFEVGRATTNNYGLLGDVDVRRAGIFMTPDADFSQEYLRSGDGQNVMQVYLKTENPLDLRGGLSETDEATLEKGGVSTRMIHNIQHHWELFDADDDGKSEFVDALRELGYDGAIFNESWRGEGGAATYVAFDPAQIKSATGNRGTFDPNSADITRSAARAPLWYSQLHQAILQAPDRLGAMSAMQWQQWLKANAAKMGVKQDEITWSGIEEYLKLRSKDKLSREELAGWVEQNGVKVEETVLGAKSTSGDVDIVERGEKFYVTGENGRDLAGPFSNWPEADAEMARIIDRDYAPAKYGEYTLPGGTSYREVLLTLPAKPLAIAFGEMAPINGTGEAMLEGRHRVRGVTVSEVDVGGKNVGRITYWPQRFNWKGEPREGGYQVYTDSVQNAWFDTLPEAKAAVRKDAESGYAAKHRKDLYKSNHWDQPNILAHVRLNDRTDADGKKVLFVEEIQSDWAQAGRKKGFGDALTPAEVAWFNKTRRDIAEGAASEEDEHRWIEMNERSAPGKPPRAPFVEKTDAWVALALKRVIKMAVDEGYDKVAFVNGEQSADRYDLSKQIDRIEARRVAKDSYLVKALSKTRGDAVIDDEFTAEKLPDVVGKEVAVKVIEAAEKAAGRAPIAELPDGWGISMDRMSFPGKPYTVIPAGQDHGQPYAGWHATEQEAIDAALSRLNASQGNVGVVRGLDLKVGGEGMRAFYDQIVPQVARDVLKKVGGGQVGSVRAGPYVTGNRIPRGFNGAAEYLAEHGVVMGHGRDDEISNVEITSRADLELFWNSHNGARFTAPGAAAQQPGFDITDKMREAVHGGLPLFSVHRNDPALESWAEAALAGRPTRDAYKKVAAKLPHAAWLMAGLDGRLPVTIDRRLVSHLRRSGHEEVTAGMIGRLASLMERPRVMIRNEGVDGNGEKITRYQALVDARDHLGRPLLVAVRKSKEGAGDVYDVRSMFGRQESMQYVLDQLRHGNVVWMADKEVAALRDFTGGSTVPRAGAAGAQPSRVATTVIVPGDAAAAAYPTKGWKQNGNTITIPVDARRRAEGAAFSVGRDPQVDTDAFRAWFGGSKVVDEEGRPLVVYHGTTHDFTSFKPRAGNADNDFGRGIYATSSADDAGANYAGEGEDLTSRIERRAEQIAADNDWEYDDPRAAERARKELNGGAASVMPLYMRIENPLVLDADESTWMDERAARKFARSVDKAVRQYEIDTRGAGAAPPRETSIQLDDLVEAALDGGRADRLIAKARNAAQYVEDLKSGAIISSEIVRKAIAAAGYDGVIDRTVSKKWGVDSGRHKPMTGVSRDTAHYIAFRAEQVKSAVGNSGAFDPKSKDVTRSADRDFPIVAYRGGDAYDPSLPGPHYFMDSPEGAAAYGPVTEYRIRLDRPHRGMDAWDSRSEAMTPRKIASLRKAGYNSVIATDTGTGDKHYIVFDREHVGPEVAKSTGRDEVNSAQEHWASPGASKFDDLVYKLQDKHVDTKRVVEAVKAADGTLRDDLDVYLQEELFHGRAAKRTQDFVHHELQPLIDQMSEEGLQIADLDEYLHARHAREANAVIASRNPEVQDGGSGMFNQDAEAYFAETDPAKLRKLAAAAVHVDRMLAKTRALLVDYQLESRSKVEGWATMFDRFAESGVGHYVPLMREDEGGHSGNGTGQGFSIKGKEVKSRTGSTRKVIDILANIAMQRERTIVRGEKNRVSQALFGLAAANPNEAFWTVDTHIPSEQVYNPATGLVETRPDNLYKQRPNVVVTKIMDADGNVGERAVVFNEKNERALRMAEALKNLDAAQLEGLLGMSAKLTRYFASVNTQYNPVFGVVNLVRDVQGALVNLGTTEIADKKAEVARQAMSALRGIYGDLRAVRKGGEATSTWAQLWEEFQLAGGQTGYRDLFRTSKDRAKAIEHALDPTAWMDSKLGKIFTANGALKVPMAAAQRGAKWIFDWLSDYNEAMENGVRLAAYKTALDAGLSKERAASLAKNLTVNFNRKGQAAQQAGALYAFFNASAQGTARLGATLFDMEPGKPKTIRLSGLGKKVVYGGLLLGSLQALALAAAGFGDDDPPEWQRERSLIIPIGDKKFITIPLPLGLHIIPNIGRVTTAWALGGFRRTPQRLAGLLGSLADAFNPIGNAGLSMQTLAPTALDPLVALTENRDWSGRPIARESRNKATPGHALARDTASSWSKLLSEGINYLSGGTKYTAGVLSPTPDQIDYLVSQVTGGVGRELTKAEQSARAAVSGETVPLYKVPLVGRFVGNAKSQTSEGNAFYSNLERLNEIETEIKGLRKDGKAAEANAVRMANPMAYLITQANHAERQVQKLRKQKSDLIRAGAPREQVVAIEERITARMAALNRAVEKLRAN